jgi:hypothetical protein
MESPRPSKKRKTQVRFDDADDDALLKEILAVNPFQVERGGKTVAWAKVAAALALYVDARRCRERCTLMLSEFKVKMAKSAAASGIDEEHTEKDDLLANVLKLPLRESSGLGTPGCAINAIASSARMTPSRLAARTVSSSSILTGWKVLNSVTGSINTIHLIYTLGLLNIPRCYQLVRRRDEGCVCRRRF